MTKSEQMILENQAKILMALSVLLLKDDPEMARNALDAANITIEQIMEWAPYGSPIRRLKR